MYYSEQHTSISTSLYTTVYYIKMLVSTNWKGKVCSSFQNGLGPQRHTQSIWPPLSPSLPIPHSPSPSLTLPPHLSLSLPIPHSPPPSSARMRYRSILPSSSPFWFQRSIPLHPFPSPALPSLSFPRFPTCGLGFLLPLLFGFRGLFGEISSISVF